MDASEYESCINHLCVACMDESVCMGMFGFKLPFTRSLMFTPLLSPPPLSLCLYPCSTRKQNYMMNFARQTGARHYYSRKRRALHQRAWTHRDGTRPLTCQSHIDRPRPSFCSWQHLDLPSPTYRWSAFDFPHTSLPTFCHKHRPFNQLTPANQGLPNHTGRREWNSEERSEAAILFTCFLGQSGFLVVF